MTENLPARMQSGGGVAAIIPQDLAQIMQLAEIIAASGMAPKAYLKAQGQGYDPSKITVGILHGMEVGLTPLASLQSIAVINGTPAIWGDGLIALIRASGLLEDISETIEGESLARTATCIMKRKGQATPIVRTFSMQDARKAGLMGKAGPWTQYPDRMCQLRARSFCGRDGFADVLRGLHTAEEVLDMGPAIPVESAPIDAPARPTRAEFTATATVVTDAETVEDLTGHPDYINARNDKGGWAWSRFLPELQHAIGAAERRDQVESILLVNDEAVRALTDSGPKGIAAVDGVNALASRRIAELEPGGTAGTDDDEIPGDDTPAADIIDWPAIAQAMIDRLVDPEPASKKAIDVILATPLFQQLPQMEAEAAQQHGAVAELIKGLRDRLPAGGKGA